MPRSQPPTPVTLVLGGARSGKSRYAEALIEACEARPVYLATARTGTDDEEMRARIARHRARRGDAWNTVEEPLDLCGALARHARPHSAVLVECLTLWLSNLLLAERPVEDAVAALTRRLGEVSGPVVLVSNEVGHGIVPDNALARRFRDHAGWMNQAVADAAQSVVLVTAGLPMVLKQPTTTKEPIA